MLQPMEIGDRIRAERMRYGLTQRALAEKLGVDKSAVAQWEGGGGGKGIKLDNLVEVARVLQIQPSTLLDEAASADSMTLRDPKEIAAIVLLRRLAPELREVHMRLLYAQAGVGHPAEPERHPGNRKRIAR